MDETDKVVELELGCVPEAAISGGVLIRTDQSTFLTFNAKRVIDNQQREGIGHAVVEFPRCLLTQFGYPNDEALAGHPLYASGLRAYGIYEVLNSSWGQRIDEQNRVVFPKFVTYAARHFIITFHESTFECLANGIHLEVSSEPYARILARITERVVSE